jgi:type II secretory pathway pseudopilin PulG
MQGRSAQSGQVGLVILLVMVVVSTVGLSVASRSTQEITTSRQGQEATKTFAAAESAIERILSEASEGSFSFEGNSQNQNFSDLAPDTTVSVDIAKQFSLNSRLQEGTIVEADVSGAADGDVLRLEWGESRNCADDPAALLVEILSVSGGNAQTRYGAISPCDRGDNFTVFDPDDSQYQGSEQALRYDIGLAVGDARVRISPVYASTPLSLGGTGAWTNNAQQFTITAVGTNQAEGGRETKAIEVERTRPYAPSVLDYALVSGTTIVK